MDELKELIKDVPRQPEIVFGDEGINEVAVHPEAEAVITGIVGCAGVQALPTLAALQNRACVCASGSLIYLGCISCIYRTACFL